MLQPSRKGVGIMNQVMIHILAKDKAAILPYWLEQNLDKLDYPKDKVHLYFRTNNNNDNTAEIIQLWADDQSVLHRRNLETAGFDSHHDWASIEVETSDVPEQVQRFGIHEWNAERFDVLAKLREEGIERARYYGCHYFVVDVDNFILPGTLKALVETGKDVVAPLLRYAVAPGEEQLAPYANYHHPVSESGYFFDSQEYYDILNGVKRGLLPVDLVHCTYLIRHDLLEQVSYFDGTQDYEYVRFSRNLRNAGIQQYLDNRQVYGYLTLYENLEAVKHWMGVLSESQAK